VDRRKVREAERVEETIGRKMKGWEEEKVVKQGKVGK